MSSAYLGGLVRQGKAIISYPRVAWMPLSEYQKVSAYFRQLQSSSNMVKSYL